MDSGLLLLLVVGATSRDLIAKHKRLRQYGVEDFDLLVNFLGQARIVVTPNACTEVSNLADQGVLEPLRSSVIQMFQYFLAQFDERHHASAAVAKEPEFARLGLADCAWISISEPGTILLTDDLDLYLAALDRGMEVQNFTHMRTEAGLI